MVDILQAVSKLGVTVVSIIHQPRIEIFERFDDVLLLAPGGRTAYFGPIARAKDYFTSLGFRFDSEANPADVLMDIVSGRGQRADPDREVPVDLASQWVSSGSTVHVDLSTTTTTESGGGPTNKAMRSVAARRGATWLQQAFHCHNRSLLKQSRELTSLQLEVGAGAGSASPGSGPNPAFRPTVVLRVPGRVPHGQRGDGQRGIVLRPDVGAVRADLPATRRLADRHV